VRVAVAGAGIAGMAAAYRGGHAYTVVADGHALDAGVVVCNERNYPEILELMRELAPARA
jgi:predicted NAD/FAD-binding protein